METGFLTSRRRKLNLMDFSWGVGVVWGGTQLLQFFIFLLMHFLKDPGILTFYIKKFIKRSCLIIKKISTLCRIRWGRILSGLIENYYPPCLTLIPISLKVLNCLIQKFSPKGFINDHVTLSREELMNQSCVVCTTVIH